MAAWTSNAARRAWFPIGRDFRISPAVAARGDGDGNLRLDLDLYEGDILAAPRPTFAVALACQAAITSRT